MGQLGVENPEEKEESRNEKFRRLAKVRVEKISDGLRKLGNLSSSNYEYGNDEVAAMFGFIRERLKETEAKFKRKEDQIPKFSFESFLEDS